MKKKLEINLLFRKKQPQFNSIEELFAWLIPSLKAATNINRIEMPFTGVSLKSVLGNIRFARGLNRNSVVHLTGHDNYVAPFCGKHVVLTIHDIGSAIVGTPFKKFMIKLFWFWIPALFVKKITVISEYSANEVRKLLPFAKKKIRVVYNPINPVLTKTKKDFNSSLPSLLFIGTKENKNLERSIKALEGLNISLHIIGKLSPTQVQLLKQHHLSYTNEYFIPYQRIIECYQEADIVLFPSLYEGFGLPILEAQAIGKPIITSNVASMPEVAGKGAFLIDPYSIPQIRATVITVIEDEKQRQTKINAGFKNTARFNDKTIAQQYIEVYKSVY